jgi:hypothetical protein
VLIERIGMGGDLGPPAAAGNDGKDGGSGGNDPHIMLQLWHVLLGRGFLRERPRQHEFGFKDRFGPFDAAIQGRRHPAQHRMPNVALHIRKDLPGIGLVPSPIQLLGCGSKLDDKVAGQVLGLYLAPLFLPEPQDGTLIRAHDDAGIRAADAYSGAGVPLCPLAFAVADLS